MSATLNEAFRPCHGCGRHYTACVCNRKSSNVLFHLQCPYCTYEFRISVPMKLKWEQRCGQCFKTFDAINPIKEHSPDAANR